MAMSIRSVYEKALSWRGPLPQQRWRVKPILTKIFAIRMRDGQSRAADNNGSDNESLR